jgi:hypothetical protein
MPGFDAIRVTLPFNINKPQPLRLQEQSRLISSIVLKADKGTGFTRRF